MIDARAAAGVPRITIARIVAPEPLITPPGAELLDWQVQALRGWGFEVARL